MRIWSGLTWSQIAELSETSSSSAQRNYAAAIEKIRIQMESTCLTKPEMNHELSERAVAG